MTTKAKEDDKVELHKYTTFKLDGITYVPHYRDVKRYVGPGYPRHTTDVFTASDLFSRKAGARSSSGKVAPKYRNPSTGETWTGRGKAPKWIEGRDRSSFII